MKYVKTYTELNYKSAQMTKQDVKLDWKVNLGYDTYIRIKKIGHKYQIKVFVNI